MIEKYITWEKTGLLKDLDDNQKIELSNKLDEARNFLIEYKDILEKQVLQCLLPAIARLYRQNNNVDILLLVEELKKEFSKTPNLSYYHIDHEAEIVSIAVDNYLNKYKER